MPYRALFFLFYFNRLFATLVSYGIRAYTWHKLRCYVDITSLQISLLGGRIFFKSIRYHGHNETILVHDGHITWRYWLRQVQDADIFLEQASDPSESSSNKSEGENETSRARSRSVGKAEKAETRRKQDHPCRIFVRVNGVEAFLYNRSPAYDSVISNIMERQAQKDYKVAKPEPSSGEKNGADGEKSNSDESTLEPEKTKSSNDFSFRTQNTVEQVERPQIPSFLRLLPVQIECRKAAAAVGNEHSTCVVTAKIDNAVGKINAARAGPMDLYKLLFDFDFKNAIVHFKPNHDFKNFQLEPAARTSKHKHVNAFRRQWRRFRLRLFRPFQTLWYPISRLASRRSSTGSIRTASTATIADDPTNSQRKIPGQSQWQGLARYLDDIDKAQHDEWDEVEYARTSQIAECEKATMRFYWDIPGTVRDTVGDGRFIHGESDNVNGFPPPEYGLELYIHGATINYGPWADRQRIVLQHLFFPASYVDARPMEPIRGGNPRLATVFKLFLCLEKDVVLRIPTREPSKDWKWHGRTAAKRTEEKNEEGVRKRRGRHNRRFGKGRKRNQGTSGADIRPFGWLDIKVSADSTINYAMDMYARKDGFHNHLNLEVKGSEISTSVNHGLLWRTGLLSLDANISNPLDWNTLRKWLFRVSCRDLDLFILRDHMFLLTDLIADWSSGPPADFYTFVPFQYRLDVSFTNFKLFLNSNDANLVNTPTDFDDNNFLILHGEELKADLGIPIDQYRPSKNEITFDVRTRKLSLDLHTPPRITLSNLLRQKCVAELGMLTLSGSHSQFTETAADLTDILRMDITGYDLRLQMYGFLLRHFVNVKENYFGEFMHFKTLEEFQAGGTDAAAVEQNESQKQISRRSNDLDVILCIATERPVIMLPSNLYSAEKYMKAEVPTATVDLRVTNYYLDLAVDISPVVISHVIPSADNDIPEAENSGPQLVIDGVGLVGHRLFGLPPTEPAYVSNWDVDVGAISGECSLAFIQGLAQAGRAFAFAMDDYENAIPLAQTPAVPDIVFLRLKTATVNLWLATDKGVIGVSCDPVDLTFDDRAGSLFSGRLNAQVPNLTLICADGPHHLHHTPGEVHEPVARCYAFAQTSVMLTMVQRKLHFTAEREKQQAHVRHQDTRTRRADFLVDRNLDIDVDPAPPNELDSGPPSMPAPHLPLPVRELQQLEKHEVDSLSGKEDTSSVSETGSEGAMNAQTHTLSGDPLITAAGDSRRRSLANHHSLATMSLSSPFAQADFPLTKLEIDINNVPTFSALQDGYESDSETGSFDGAYINTGLDERMAHTALIVKLEPGVRMYLDPRVNEVLFDIISGLLPKTPSDIVDTFQIDVMGNVLSSQERKKNKGGALELNFTVPSIDARICNEIQYESADRQVTAQDQIDIDLSYLTITVRTKSSPQIDDDATSSLLLHTTLESASVSIAENTGDGVREKDAIRLGLEDVLVWLVFTKNRSLYVSFRDLTTLVPAQQAHYFTSFVPRVVALSNSVKGKAEHLAPVKVERLRYVALFLAKNSEHAVDPPYLTRMTYVLRAFPHHFRNQESWKIVTRFRHAFGTLTAEKCRELAAELAGDARCPTDARSQVIDSWTQWCSWDVPNLERTQVFSTLLGNSETEVQEQDLLPLDLTVRSGLLRVLIECGPHTNELSIDTLALGLKVIPPTEPTGLKIVEDNLRTNIVLQAHISKILLRINWAILEEIEAFLQIIKKEEVLAPEPKLKRQQSGKAPGAVLDRQDFHVVLSTDEGSIGLDSINLHHLSRAQGLKLSIIGTNSASLVYGTGVSAIVTAEHALTELRGNSQRIWRTDLSGPSIYVDYKERQDRNTAEINIGGAYNELHVVVEQEILGFLDVIDSVITEEVAYIQRVRKSLDGQRQEYIQRAPATPRNLVLQFNVALLAGSFSFNLALSKTLSLTMSGKTANLRVVPKTAEEIEFDIEMDLGAVTHALVSKDENASDQQAIIDTPPVSGRVGLQLLESKTSLTVATMVQEVRVEAAALQSVLTIANRAEVQSILKTIKSEIDTIRGHLAGIMHDEAKPVLAAADKPKAFIYNINTALSGLRVHATAPVMAPKKVKAELVFGIGPVAVLASNVPSSSGGQKLVPDIQAMIEDIGATLTLVERSRRKPCGHVTFGLTISSRESVSSPDSRTIKATSDSLEVNIFPDTAATIVDIITYVQQKIGDLDLSREVVYLRRLRASRAKRMKARVQDTFQKPQSDLENAPSSTAVNTNYHLDLNRIRLVWVVVYDASVYSADDVHDLELSLSQVHFSVRRQNEARLAIQNLQLQTVPKSSNSIERTLNSALLPEMIFTVRYESESKQGISLAFQAAGKALDLRLDSRFAIPVSILEKSGSYAIEKFRAASSNWKTSATDTEAPRKSLLGGKRLKSLLVDADFAGAVVYLQGSVKRRTLPTLTAHGKAERGPYSQRDRSNTVISTTLRAPGVALKLEYSDAGVVPSLNGEVKVEGSSNTIYPDMVPIVLQISDSVKEIVREGENAKDASARAEVRQTQPQKPAANSSDQESLLTTDPTALLGKTQVNLGLRICRQEFGLSCQPLARINAKAQIEDIYLTMNTVDSPDLGHFVTASVALTKFGASVQHFYSRESTFSFDMDSVVLTVMNSKHLSNDSNSGVSAGLKIFPTKTKVNARQIQDLLLFREIWLPPELRGARAETQTPPADEPQEYLVQRYQHVASAAAFPWNATVSIAELSLDLDLGQSIGRPSFSISNMWASSKKSSGWKQDLCIGVDQVNISSTGRLSGFITLDQLSVRTSIEWPSSTTPHHKAPLIQASIGFGSLRAKTAFDYQAFAFADIANFNFLMYNIREGSGGSRDRLVAILDGDKVFVFCTTTSAAQAVGLVQAFERLVKEKQEAYNQSVKDVEKQLNRQAVDRPQPARFPMNVPPLPDKDSTGFPISLHTDVLVTLRAISFGAFPSTFFDSQILKLEASDVQARFAVGLEDDKIYSNLGMTLGQLQVALASVKRVGIPKTLGDISIDEVITNASTSRGGIILRVPKVVASMQTWQAPDTNHIDYIFRSLFEGKIDVGWNYSRISFIRGMWETHSRSLASRLGKPLPESAVKITADRKRDTEAPTPDALSEDKGKITAVVNVPQSKYEYTALEPPVIDTPQLRDMGEATPPLEWVGLHRDRLPNVTHQVIIVTLLQVAKEVEDAYGRILGSS